MAIGTLLQVWRLHNRRVRGSLGSSPYATAAEGLGLELGVLGGLPGDSDTAWPAGTPFRSPRGPGAAVGGREWRRARGGGGAARGKGADRAPPGFSP